MGVQNWCLYWNKEKKITLLRSCSLPLHLKIAFSKFQWSLQIFSCMTSRNRAVYQREISGKLHQINISHFTQAKNLIFTYMYNTSNTYQWLNYSIAEQTKTQQPFWSYFKSLSNSIQRCSRVGVTNE